MAADLLYEFVKRRLDGRSRAGSFRVGGQLPRRQAQIQGDNHPLTRRTLLYDRFQVEQVRPEDVETLLNLFDLVADFLFDVGSFMDLVTDMNVHFRASNAGEESLKLRSLTKQLYTRWEVQNLNHRGGCAVREIANHQGHYGAPRKYIRPKTFVIRSLP
jgi:hypothetical protein